MSQLQSTVRATTCAQCDTPLTAIQISRRGRYCSLTCASRAAAKITPVTERFWRFVQQQDGCWEWIGNRSLKGYGVITATRTGGTRSAHRLSWEIHHGPIPEGLFVCHHCDNPPCVNPDHLFLGTAADNTADMLTKGRWRLPTQNPARHRRGTAVAHAKLTEDDVRYIRQAYADGHMSMSALGRRFGVTLALISGIIARRRWRHVP